MLCTLQKNYNDKPFQAYIDQLLSSYWYLILLLTGLYMYLLLTAASWKIFLGQKHNALPFLMALVTFRRVDLFPSSISTSRLDFLFDCVIYFVMLSGLALDIMIWTVVLLFHNSRSLVEADFWSKLGTSSFLTWSWICQANMIDKQTVMHIRGWPLIIWVVMVWIIANNFFSGLFPFFYFILIFFLFFIKPCPPPRDD